MKALSRILILLFLSAGICQCRAGKRTVYEIPSHVTDVNRKLLIEKADKGKVLFKEHCSGCHGIFTKGKDGVPNFSQTQIDNYHTAALIGIDRTNHAVARKMSNEQIDQIITFLNLRRKK